MYVVVECAGTDQETVIDTFDNLREAHNFILSNYDNIVVEVGGVAGGDVGILRIHERGCPQLE